MFRSFSIEQAGDNRRCFSSCLAPRNSSVRYQALKSVRSLYPTSLERNSSSVQFVQQLIIE